MSGPLVTAYVEIRARGDGVRGDARRVGEEAGDEAGKAASRKFSDRFRRGATDGVRGARGDLSTEGAAAGDESGKGFVGRFLAAVIPGMGAAGGASGKSFGESFTRGATGQLKGARGEFSRAGEALGEGAGEDAGTGFLRRFLTAVTPGLGAGGQRGGRAFGEGFERGSQGSLRPAVTRAQALFAHLGDSLARVTGTDRKRWDDLAGGIAGAGVATGRFAVVAAGATAATSSLASGLPVLITLGAQIAATGGLLAAAPAAYAVAGAAIGTLKLGLSGVGDALQAAFGPADKFGDAVKGMSPPVKNLATTMRGLAPAFRSVRTEVQSRLFAGVSGEIKSLAGTYLPLAKTGLGEIAGSFNIASRGAVGFAKSADTVRGVRGILQNTDSVVQVLAPHLLGLAAAVFGVGAAGSDSLPKLAGYLGQAADKVTDFLNNARETGKIGEWIQGGVVAAQQLGNVLGGLGAILKAVFSGAGSGGNPLQSLGDTLHSVADQIARPEFQQGLGDFFASLGQGAGQLRDVLPKVADALIRIAPALASLGSASGTAVASLLSSLADTVEHLAPLLNGLGSALEAISPHATAVALAVGTVYGAVKLLAGVAEAGSLLKYAASIKVVEAATNAWTGAQLALDAAMELNPFVALATAVIAVGAAVVLLYKKSENVRLGVTMAFQMTAAAVLAAAGVIVNAAAKAFGWVPGLGPKLRSAAADFDAFKTRANASLAQMTRNVTVKGNIEDLQKKLAAAKASLNSVPKEKVPLVKANIADLEAKLAVAKQRLNGTPNHTSVVKADIANLQARVEAAKASLRSVPPSKQTQIRATIAQLQSQINAARRAIGSLQGKTVVNRVTTIYRTVGQPAIAVSGNGVQGGRAGGGPVSANKLYVVGEEGPEFFLPKQAGVVIPNDVSKRMSAGLDDLSKARAVPQPRAYEPAVGVSAQQQVARFHPDDIATLAGAIASAIASTRQRVQLTTGELVGAINYESGRLL